MIIISSLQITTAITSGFLIVKVVVSKVWDVFYSAFCFTFKNYTLFPLIQKYSSFVQLLSQGAFGYLLPIISFILAWMETWLLDFKVLPQEAGDEISENQISNYSETSIYKRYQWRLMDVDDIITHLLLQCVSIIVFSNHVCPVF